MATLFGIPIPWRRIAFYAITVAGAILVYLKFAELRLLKDFFVASNWHYIGLVVVIQFFSFFGLALNYQAVLKMKQLSVSVWELFPITFVIQFISQALPTAGISGQVFFIDYLKKYSLTLAEGIGRAILELATLYTAYTVFFIISVALLFKSDAVQNSPRIIFFIYAFLIFIAICIIIFILSQKKRRDSRLHWIIDYFMKLIKKSGLQNFPGIRSLIQHSEHFTMIKEQFKTTLNFQFLWRKKKLFFLACLWQWIILMTHVFTLYVIAWSLGTPIPFAVCFIAFTFSKFLSMISVVPGAPGVFEGAMTLILLSFGIDASPALTATILTRAFTFWLPMPIGWLLYRKYTKQFETMDDKVVVS